ncbi:MAG TPA: aminoacetone oxidase family FAD-binding enzyme [Clostridia bacterium]|jgi:hypothetical protein|nr:aminoacetone oxidase family FAD-binding enzyme [Clostridia bacterium]
MTLCIFFKSRGLEIVEERGGRMFPKSNKSSDVIDIIYNELISRGITIYFNETVISLIQENNIIKEIITTKQKMCSDAVIMATGGIYYPHTGSDGLGFDILKKLGVTLIPPVPALTSMLFDDTSQELPEGLSLKNVSLSIINTNDLVIANDFGEMIFTNNGISGPIVLSLSSKINRKLLNETLFASIDLKPALPIEVLEDRIINMVPLYGKQQVKHIIPKLTVKKMTSKILLQSNINPCKQLANLTSEDIRKLANSLKGVKYQISSLDTERAVVTAGGVDVKQINPKTMQSKIIDNLFFAGEIIDVDALTGGYNLQFAFSSGVTAGRGVCEYINKTEDIINK